MKKKVFIVLAAAAICLACFIPVTKQQTLQINASFFNTYQQLARAANWRRWRKDIGDIYLADSAKISTQQFPAGFKIVHNDFSITLAVENGYSFVVNERNSNKSYDYSFTIFPGKDQNVTSVTLTENINLIKYLAGFDNKDLLLNTHFSNLRKFLENTGLYYGYNIEKKKVTDTSILVLRSAVLKKNTFTEAAKELTALKHYIATHHLEQTQPLIAQFIPKYGDSAQVNIGIPVNKQIQANREVSFMGMPKNGNLYTIEFKGKFSDRLKAYAAMKRYFDDQHLQMPTLSFETYLDNTLPLTDSAIVNIRINFPSF